MSSRDYSFCYSWIFAKIKNEQKELKIPNLVLKTNTSWSQRLWILISDRGQSYCTNSSTEFHLNFKTQIEINFSEISSV